MSAEAGLEIARRSPVDIDAPISGGELNVLYKFAKALAGSGFFEDAKQADQAFAKIIFGRDLGLSATAALTGIHIIDGKPEMSANIQASKVRGSGLYDYHVLEHDETKCSLEFTRLSDGKVLGVSTFAMGDAARAKLDGKTNWKAYPRNMLFARAMSNGVAWFCPDVMNGIRVYAEGEIAEQGITTPQAAESVVVPDSDEIVDGTLDDAPEDQPLSEEEGVRLSEALAAAGLDDNELTMLLTSVGVDCTDDLTQRSAYELRQRLGEHLAKAGAA